MTSAAPIYLVSACASGEEFVSAFRRYADRNGVVFIPIADPLPSGKKGRFALTLKNGGVMVEGDAEIVSSARTPSVLYGRVGMTIKFLVPDEPSKTMLTELEKARLALKPSAPTIAPRSAPVPAEPRPRPPVPSGRIDAVNALAECVAIGEGIPAPGEGGEFPPKNAAQKFVVPTVPSIPPGRPRTPSAPIPSSMTPTTMGVAPLPKPAPSADLLQTMRGPAPGVDLTQTAKPDLSMTMRGTTPPMATPTRNPPPASTPPPIPAHVRQPTPATALPVVTPQRTATPFAPMPIVQQPAPPIVAPPRPPVHEVEVGEPTDLAPIPRAEDAVPYAQSDSTIPIEVSHESGAAPVTVVADQSNYDLPQRVERTIREPRKTTIGIAVVPSGMMVLPAAPAICTPSEAEIRDTGTMDVPPSPTAQITVPGGAIGDVDAPSDTFPPQPPLRPPVLQPIVEEPTPSGDWTMTPGVDGPTITPTPREKAADKPAVTPPSRPTGNWVIALDPSQPDGWSEPLKIEKSPVVDQPGPPASVVSSERPLDSNRRLGTEPSWAPEPTVQVDPTLIGPLEAMPALDDEDPVPPPSVQRPAMGTDGLMPISMLPPDAASQALNEVPPMSAPMAQQMPGSMPAPMPGSMPGSFVTPPGHPNPAFAASAQSAFAPQRNVTDAGMGFFRESGDIPSYSSGPTPALDGPRRNRTILIIAAAAGLVGLAIVLLVVLGSGGDDKGKPKTPGTSDNVNNPPAKPSIAVTPNPDASSETSAVVDAAAVAVKPPIDAAVVAATDCKVTIHSVPTAAEVVIGKAVVGTTPASLTLPCGVEAKLVVRKARFVAQNRVVTPKTGAKPIKVALAKVTFSVKVSSTPPGASITVAGKPMGFTPTAVKLPAFELSTLKIAKDGFGPDTQKITPKQNNQTVHATLKKQPKMR